MNIFLIGMALTGWLFAYILGSNLTEKINELLKENNVKRKKRSIFDQIGGYILLFLCGFPVIGFFILLLMFVSITLLSVEDEELSKNFKEELLKKHRGDDN